jgi:hypothetical protein
MTFRSTIAAAAMLAAHPVAAQDHRFEADPIASVLGGECVPLRAGDRVRVYASRGPYACIYPHDTIAPCKWMHKKALSK